MSLPPDDPSRAGEAERLFEAFCVASRRAQETLRIKDGLAAGRAWAEFLAVFAPGERPNAPNVIPFRPNGAKP